MSAVNKIIKHGLEDIAKELLSEGKSTRNIADILSAELGEKITQSTVHRYFATRDQEKAKVIEKREELMARVADAEISTIEYRLKGIKVLLTIAEKGEQENNRIKASVALKDSLDSLDTRLGKLKGGGSGPNVNIFNIQEAMNGAREQLASRMSCIAAKFEEIRDPEQPD
jgi:predicted transcriptional regulator